MELTFEQQARFWSKVTVGRDEECWEWQGPIFKRQDSLSGYGAYGISGKQCLAHRVAYTLRHGSIPGQSFICHHCDNPRCVNPAHLYAGDAKSNVKDKIDRGRCNLPSGVRHHNAKLAEADVIEIKRLFATPGWSYKRIAERFQVSLGTIAAIKSGRNWKHVATNPI